MPNINRPLEGFRYSEGKALEAMDVVNLPNVSPYWLDDENRRLILVETPVTEDLSTAAFLSEAQVCKATRLYAITYQVLNKIAAKLPDPGRLILLYSTGRCGSTLLKQVFNSAQGVTALSEPSAFAQAVRLRGLDGQRDTEMADLLRSVTRLLCRPETQIWVLKFHSQVVEIAEILRDAIPSSNAIFLYRNAEGMLRSFVKAFLPNTRWIGLSSRQIELWSYQLPILKPYIDQPDSLTLAMFIAAWWLSPMQKYLELFPLNIWRCAVRYEELTTSPRRVVADLFQQCDVPPTRIEEALQVFQRDAQEGTQLSRENVAGNTESNPDLGEKLFADVRQCIATQPVINSADFILPGTIQ